MCTVLSARDMVPACRAGFLFLAYHEKVYIVKGKSNIKAAFVKARAR
jgi:hypothetical protein